MAGVVRRRCTARRRGRLHPPAAARRGAGPLPLPTEQSPVMPPLPGRRATLWWSRTHCSAARLRRFGSNRWCRRSTERGRAHPGGTAPAAAPPTLEDGTCYQRLLSPLLPRSFTAQFGDPVTRAHRQASPYTPRRNGIVRPCRDQLANRWSERPCAIMTSRREGGRRSYMLRGGAVSPDAPPMRCG
jgi:hypothetical protein